MSDLIIKIGDDALDLSPDETIAITKQAAKVGDFSTVLADGTNEVTVPLTPTNQTIMDNAHLIQSDSAKPYSRLDATVIQEGYETIQDGYAIIKSSDNNFSVQVIGGNASFFDLIKDANCRDLPLSDYIHFWTNQNAFDLRNETEGLIYAVFEQSGEDATTMTTYGTNLYAVETDLLLPSFYVKTIVDLIFEQQGYTFVTDLVNEDIYDKAVVFRGKIPARGEDMTYHECTVRCGQDFLCNLSGGTLLFGTTLNPTPNVTIDATTSIYASSADMLERVQFANGSRVNFTDSVTVTMNYTVIIDNPNLVAEDVWITVQHTTASGIVSTESDHQAMTINAVDTYNFTVTVDVEQYEGDIYLVSLVDTTPVLSNITMKDGSNYTVSDVQFIAHAPITSLFPFNYLTGETMMLDMKQGEFMKELAKMYQWVFDTNETTHTVTARRFDNIKERSSQAIDLSDKIDSRKIKTTYGIDGFAQTNALIYKEDEVTKYDGVGYINVADTTLVAEKDYVKMSNFAATSARLRFDTVNAPYVPLFDELLPTNGIADRIFLVRQEVFPYNINFNRDTETPPNHPTNTVTFAYFAEAGNLDSLDFPTLIERFYQTVVDMTDRGKTIEASVDLNIRDVMNYDPLTPVYISSMGNYFYWEKLSNYVKDKLTKCKFVKI